ncbi:MAG: acetylornithine transaminase [Candidatus Altiarchaeota archaeon]|nr:acetylornithine transaminase [Candidatus Altiarchaeota archaeon]
MDLESVKKLDQRYLMQTYRRYDVAPVEGRGCKIWDIEGNEYLDLTAGVAVCALGHAHPRLVHAISEQAKKLGHVSNLYYIQQQAELAKMLCDLSPIDSCRAFFCNSGTEANEAAIKFARKHTGKSKIIAMHNSFHGRTIGALAITDKEKYQKPFVPLMPDTEFVDFGDLRKLKYAVDEKTAAVFLEIIQGEGGIVMPKKSMEETSEYLAEVKDLCEKKGVVMVIDEVQSGMGRTGKLFTCEHFGLKPDIITMAKGLGGGFPIGAVLADEKIAKSITYGDHGTTFGGSPLACEVSRAVLETVLEEGLCQNAAEVGWYFMEKLQGLKDKYDVIKDVRGLGLIIGVEMESKEKADETRLEMQKRGVLINVTAEKVIRFIPPLIIHREEIDFAIENLEEVLKDV